MAIKPILFNTEMVRAILDGRKTCTRRLVRFLPGENPQWTGYIRDGLMLYNGRNEPCIRKSPYQPGDILYVRETWQCWRAHRYEATADIRFRAGGDDVRLQFANGNTDSINRLDYDTFVHKWFSHNGEWKPSLFMPKEEVHGLFERTFDFARPKMYELGYANNNCVGCVKGGMGYWNHIRKDFPEVFESRAKLEREVGHSMLKDKNGPVYLDELDPNRGDMNTEIMPDCGIMCYLSLN